MSAEQRLWAEVLFLAIQDAVHGVREASLERTGRIRMVQRARDFINSRADFEQVCSLAGIDPEAARERILPMIAKAPPPEEIVSGRAKNTDGSRVPNRRAPSVRRKTQKGAGVVVNSRGSVGTGGGTRAQETPKIAFYE